MKHQLLSSHRILLFLLLIGAGNDFFAQDSIDHRFLQTVTISSGNHAPDNQHTQTPTQSATAEEMDRLGHLQISDAVRQMAGVSLKDYGGIGGVKTISIRGLGSQFSTLTIDGVAVNDAQNGQIDLGRYLIGDAQFISLSNGQSSLYLQTARAYAAGNILNLESDNSHPRSTRLTLGMETGSFGLLSPTLLWKQPLGKRMHINLYANLLKSKGNYPFTLYYGLHEGDSCSVERRQNSQMHMGTLDGSLFYNIDHYRRWESRVHLTSGEHALPGPVTFYSIKGSEHSEEFLLFVQSRYCHRWNERWEGQIVGKWQRSTDVYEDTASRMSFTGRLRNEYRQQEGYLSGTIHYAPATHWHLSLSSDGAYNSLISNLSQCNDVDRTSLLSVMRARYRTPHWDLDANLLSTFAQEQARTSGKDEQREHHYQKLSPFVGASWRGNRTNAPRIRYFFKETYRLPSFSEMYYFTLTRDLEPEKALQHNLGITWALPTASETDHKAHWDNGITLDLYYNNVSNKIIAVPTKNMFLWSMSNLGKVEIIGGDLTFSAIWRLERAQLSIKADYSYQHAVDKSDPSANSYNNQIPYTPRHSGNLNFQSQLPWLDAGFTSAWVGARYSMQQNTPYNRLDPYVDIGLHLGRNWYLKHCVLQTQFQVLNLLNQQYEVVKNYPMMGRNYRISIKIKL